MLYLASSVEWTSILYLFLLFAFTVNKVDTLKRYKFSLAFENSNEEDYVTEKYFQSLVAGNTYCCITS